ncbi:MAG: DUF2884 family protein [Pseudomonadota bacterium]|jgi:hypothetical protein|nr:DUF2884 family protein [Pseudomonadota bacterium]
MRVLRYLLILLPGLAVLPSPVRAQDLAATCHASSSYDITLAPDRLQFDRAAPAPLQVTMAAGVLRTDGATVPLDAEGRDRLALFERDVRALAPRVRALAQQGVDIVVQGLRADAAGLGLSADAQADFDHRLANHARELKQRIAASRSSRDWQGDAANQYANQMAADLLPVVATDLGQQALNAALAGDMQAAAALRDRAASMATDLQPRLRRRLQVLRPQVEALCPAITRLAELQQGLRDARGRPLELLHVGS